jgi:hypothetical protein
MLGEAAVADRDSERQASLVPGGLRQLHRLAQQRADVLHVVLHRVRFGEPVERLTVATYEDRIRVGRTAVVVLPRRAAHRHALHTLRDGVGLAGRESHATRDDDKQVRRRDGGGPQRESGRGHHSSGRTGKLCRPPMPCRWTLLVARGGYGHPRRSSDTIQSAFPGQTAAPEDADCSHSSRQRIREGSSSLAVNRVLRMRVTARAAGNASCPCGGRDGVAISTTGRGEPELLSPLQSGSLGETPSGPHR